MKDIANVHLTSFRIAPEKLPGTLCLARYSMDGLCYRAKVISVSTGDHNCVMLKVAFVDYGNEEWVSYNHIYNIPPPLSFEPPMQVSLFSKCYQFYFHLSTGL